MTDQTDHVLSSIDATLEGWHGRDGTVSGDAMRWAPEEPSPATTAASHAAWLADWRATYPRTGSPSLTSPTSPGA